MLYMYSGWDRVLVSVAWTIVRVQPVCGSLTGGPPHPRTGRGEGERGEGMWAPPPHRKFPEIQRVETC